MITGKAEEFVKLKSLDEVLERDELHFRTSYFLHSSKSICNIAKAIQEVLGSTYVFTKKIFSVILNKYFTFLLSAFGSLWPIALTIVLISGLKVSNNDYNDARIFMPSVILISLIASGFLSISIRQIYVYKQFLKIQRSLSLSELEIKQVKHISFWRIILSPALVFMLPIDFLKEFSRSWLGWVLSLPFILISTIAFFF